MEWEGGSTGGGQAELSTFTETVEELAFEGCQDAWVTLIVSDPIDATGSLEGALFDRMTDDQTTAHWSGTLVPDTEGACDL